MTIRRAIDVSESSEVSTAFKGGKRSAAKLFSKLTPDQIPEEPKVKISIPPEGVRRSIADEVEKWNGLLWLLLVAHEGVAGFGDLVEFIVRCREKELFGFVPTDKSNRTVIENRLRGAVDRLVREGDIIIGRDCESLSIVPRKSGRGRGSSQSSTSSAEDDEADPEPSPEDSTDALDDDDFAIGDDEPSAETGDDDDDDPPEEESSSPVRERISKYDDRDEGEEVDPSIDWETIVADTLAIIESADALDIADLICSEGGSENIRLPPGVSIEVIEDRVQSTLDLMQRKGAASKDEELDYWSLT